ncbi:MAG TPA: ECF-type sigma factor [Dokdonella sp.]|nr:ECF-type sigma factor [Dokdonella sp.]
MTAPDSATHAIPAADTPAQPFDVLFATVYKRLKAMASRQLARRAGDTLDTTALVHEMYLRVGKRDPRFDREEQFFAYAARAMRHLLADRARDRLRLRAGGAWTSITLNGDDARLSIDNAEQALQLEDALTRLEQHDPRAARIVELRYFAGLSLEQVADALGLGRRTVVRDWRFARAFLHEKL